MYWNFLDVRLARIMISLVSILEALVERCKHFNPIHVKCHDFFPSFILIYTRPRTQCFSEGTYKLFTSHTVLQRGYDVGRTNASDPLLRDRLIHLQTEAEALLKTQFTVCNEVMGDQLRYMGTSTVVRDIDFITKTLEGRDALM